jgi:cation diffusion facilitator family transporter
MNNEKIKVASSSVLAAFFITTFKLIVGLFTGSLGIISEALHSGLDMLAAGITYLSVKFSDKPADDDHNYGHGKIENLSALLESILLLITCIWIIYEAINRLIFDDTQIDVSIWSYLVVITSIVIDFSRSSALMRVAKKFNSQALEADALHFTTDIWSSLVVLLGLVIYQFLGWHAADAVASMIVACIVLYVAYKMGRKAIDILLDISPKDTLSTVKKILSEFPEISEYHDLKARTAGADTFIKFNLHLNPTMSLTEAHNLCDRIESRINKQISRSEVYIHPEPNDDSHHFTKTEY